MGWHSLTKLCRFQVHNSKCITCVLWLSRTVTCKGVPCIRTHLILHFLLVWICFHLNLISWYMWSWSLTFCVLIFIFISKSVSSHVWAAVLSGGAVNTVLRRLAQIKSRFSRDSTTSGILISAMVVRQGPGSWSIPCSFTRKNHFFLLYKLLFSAWKGKRKN